MRRKARTARTSGIVGLAAALGLLGPTLAWGDVVTLPASQDNTLYEDASGALSNGAGERLFAGRVGATTGGSVRRAVIAFDVAGSIPPGATINSAALTLNMSRSQRADAETFTLHRLLSDWGEGTSVAAGQEGGGGPASSGDATWIHTFHDTGFWSSAGGDFAPTPSASLSVNRKGFYTWGSTPGMVADVTAWLANPSANFGWILIGNEGALETAKRFDSRENGTAGNRPALQVDFTPAAASGACCAPDGTCGVPGAEPECSAQGGAYQGDGVSCTPNPCPEPLGACCLPVAAATCLVDETETSCGAQGGTFQGALTSCTPNPCPVVLEPFVDALPLPAVAQPVSGSPGGTASYTIAMREVQQQLHRDLPPTTVWGYGDGPTGATYPGPTIEALTSQPVTVTWQNDLRDTAAGGSPPPLRTTHYLSVDECPHGATENKDAKTVVHLHGAHVEPASDGYPEATFSPGQQVVYEYPNWQLPATLWYHDHALGITRLNVYMGLAGFYLIRDTFEKGLGLPSGEFEVSVAIQDRTFNPDGSLQYPSVWQDVFFGDTVLVNGKVWPYLNVKRGKYRLRLLSGSTTRTYTLSLDNGAPFVQIGAEGGLLPAPVTVNEITLGSGERADVIVDFSPYAAGTEIKLTNSAPAPFPSEAGVGVIPDVMKFVVTSETGHTDPVPTTLRPMEVLHEAEATKFREFHLEKAAIQAGCSPFEWLIRSIDESECLVPGAASHWDDICELPELGETEVWRFVNKSGMTHPMHLHLVMFQVLDRQAFELIGGEVVPIGSPVPPPPGEAGWKDTVQVGPNEIVRVIARFENYEGLYAYHCHILEHEDHEMMRQFQSVSTVADCQDGIDNDGDGLTDFSGDDPGCSAATDVSEKAPTRVCDDGIDNDGDGLIDFPDDPDCTGPTDPLEAPDADGDGIPDALDNCLLIANGPSAGVCYSAGVQIDTDGDGYGNICDGDFNQDGVADFGDIPAFLADTVATVDSGIGSDMNCDGVPDFADIPAFLTNTGVPGPGP
jgi:spore coat protein A